MRRPVSTRHAPGVDSDAGSVSLFFVVAVLGMFAALGLVVEGGARVRAIQLADAAAAEAARAAGQQVDPASVASGIQGRLDAGAAARAAQSYLGAIGVTGDAAVTYQEGTAVITVTTSVVPQSPLAGLGLLAPGPVTGSASARVEQSVAGGTP